MSAGAIVALDPRAVLHAHGRVWHPPVRHAPLATMLLVTGYAGLSVLTW